MDQTRMKHYIRDSYPDLYPDIDFDLRSIRVNGQYRGTSGFLEDKATGSIYYVSTEPSCNPKLTYLYRTAESHRDYTGGFNQFAKDLKGLCDSVMESFQSTRDRELEDEMER